MKTQLFKFGKEEYKEAISKLSDEQLKSETGSQVLIAIVFMGENLKINEMNWKLNYCADECDRRDQGMYKKIYNEVYDDEFGLTDLTMIGV